MFLCTNSNVCISFKILLPNIQQIASSMIDAFFTPIPEETYQPFKGKKALLGGNVQAHFLTFPKLQKPKIALIGLGDRANEVRKQLYSLAWRFDKLPIVDLGNIVQTSDKKQQEFAISEAIGELISLNITVIVLAETDPQLYAHFNAYRNSDDSVELVHVSSTLNFDKDSDLNRIVSTNQNKHLFNIDFLGTQSYLITQETSNTLEKLYFENYRLGMLRNQMEETEPVLRSSHLMSFDLNSIRFSDAPGVSQPNPNGFYAEEACQIARYAGLSNKLSSAQFYGFSHSPCPITDNLAAQLIWYFLDGYITRYNDHPDKEDADYLIYRNKLESTGHEINFYKSRKSNRWWMEIPHPYDNQTFFIGCSYKDYQLVCDGEMPDRWWRAYQRLI